MEQRLVTPSLLNKLSCATITLASVAIIFISVQPPAPCTIPTLLPSPHSQTLTLQFPKSSCQTNQRELVPLEKKAKKLWSSRDWRKKVDSFSSIFLNLETLGFFNNDSKILCVSAGAGHEVMAFMEIGAEDVTGVEIFDAPPLVSRADPHDLPFFDGVFDLGFSAHFDESLFPSRFVSEIERTVRKGGVSVLIVEPRSEEELRKIRVLFQGSSLIGVSNVMLFGAPMTQLIMRIGTST